MSEPIPVLEYDEQRYKDTKEAFERLREQRELAEDYETQAKLKARYEEHQEATANVENSLQSALSAVGQLKADKITVVGAIKDAAKKLETGSVAYRNYRNLYQRVYQVVLNHFQWRAKAEGFESWQVQGLVEDFIEEHVGFIESELQGDFEHIIWGKVVG